MLVFQVNPNQLKNDLQGKDWLFWNAYLSERVKENDYVLLPDYIDFISDTNNVTNQDTYLVEVGEESDEDWS